MLSATEYTRGVVEPGDCNDGNDVFEACPAYLEQASEQGELCVRYRGREGLHQPQPVPFAAIKVDVTAGGSL